VPYGHLGKLYLLRRAMFRLVLALVAKVAAVVLLHLLAAPAPLGCRPRAHCVGAAARQHAAIFEAVFQRQASLSGSLEVF
jgi:hypothetical protein